MSPKLCLGDINMLGSGVRDRVRVRDKKIEMARIPETHIFSFWPNLCT